MAFELLNLVRAACSWTIEAGPVLTPYQQLGCTITRNGVGDYRVALQATQPSSALETMAFVSSGIGGTATVPTLGSYTHISNVRKDLTFLNAAGAAAEADGSFLLLNGLPASNYT